jgi:hypothetical protein
VDVDAVILVRRCRSPTKSLTIESSLLRRNDLQEADFMPLSSPIVKPSEPSDVSGNSVVLALKDGDRLTREEFERRYDAMPDLKKAELIEGVVHVASPVRQREHGRTHVHINF